MSEDLYFAAGFSSSADLKKLKTLAELEREYIEHVLALFGGNVPAAAKVLGIAPSTLYRKRVQWKT